MPRLTVTFDADLYEWIEREADARDRSKAWVITQAVKAARDGGDRITDDHRTGDHHRDDRLTDLVTAVEDLTDRVADLEAAQTTPAPQADRGGQHTDAASVNGSGSAPASNGGGVATGTASAVDVPAVGRDDVDSDVEAAVRETVARVADNWEDDPDRLAARKRAAVAVLTHAVVEGEAVGKSDAIDAFESEYGVAGQSPETWWRKNIRPVLSAVGDYSQGAHGYRVDAGDLVG